MGLFRSRCWAELSRLETADERASARRHVIKTIAKSTKFRLWGLATVVGSVCVALLLYRGFFLLDDWMSSWHVPRTLLILILVAAGLACPEIMLVFTRRWKRDALRQYLADRGIPICAACGYDLTGRASSRCSECGTPIPPQLAPDSPGKAEPAKRGPEKAEEIVDCPGRHR